MNVEDFEIIFSESRDSEEGNLILINPLTPNDHYRGRTTPLTSKVAFYILIQQI